MGSLIICIEWFRQNRKSQLQLFLTHDGNEYRLYPYQV